MTTAAAATVFSVDTPATADATYAGQISSTRHHHNPTNQECATKCRNKVSNLSHLLYEKEYYTLSELENLRKAIECQ